MTTSSKPEIAPLLTAPAGLNLLGDQDAGTCCGGSCAMPAE